MKSINTDKIIKQIQALATKVAKNIIHEQELGLLKGLSGQLLFLILAEHHFPGTINCQTLKTQVARLQTELANVSYDFSLGSGISGIGMSFELIQKVLDDTSNINQEIDKALLKMLQNFKGNGEYELLQGLTGVMLYALHRLEHSTGQVLLDSSLQNLLNLGSNIDSTTLVWTTKSNSPFKIDFTQQSEFNLGTAHGNTGTLGVFIKIYKKEPTDKLKTVIQQLSHWLLKQGSFSSHDSYFGYTNGDTKQSRLAWCYGDLNNSLILWHAGRLLDDSFITARAKQIALLAAKRRLENSGVDDFGLCHGASGNAVIFQTLYREMQEQSLLDAANYWFSLLIEAANSEKAANALWRYNPTKQNYVECFGLLEGYAGIGLSLLSLLGFDTSWQNCLLMD